MQQRRQQAEHDRRYPYLVIGPGGVVRPATPPNADEASQLVREENDAEQSRHVADAEDLRHQAAGQGHRTQPQNAHRGCEHQHRGFRQRHHQERGDQYCAQEIKGAEQVFLRIPPAQRPAAVSADDVEETDQRDRHGPGGGGEPGVQKIGREMNGDERDLKPAHEEPGCQVQIPLMPGGFAHGLAQGLRRVAFGSVGRTAGQGHRQGHHHHRQPGDVQKCRRPADSLDEPQTDRRHVELPEGAAGAGDAQGERAFFSRHPPGDGGQHDGETGRRLAEADEQAGADV